MERSRAGETTTHSRSTRKSVTSAAVIATSEPAPKAKLTTVGGLADVLRFADIKAEFEKWWQMKQTAAGAKAQDHVEFRLPVHGCRVWLHECHNAPA